MNHPTPEELARDALGLPAPAPLAEHLAACPACRDRRDALRALSARLADAYDGAEAPADGRARLLAALSRSTAPSRPTPPPLVPFWKDPIMRRRLFAGGAAASLAIVATALWLATGPRPAFAMSQVAEAVRAARSYQYSLTMRTPQGAGEPRAVMTSRCLWLAPGSTRCETSVIDAEGRTTPDMTEIQPAGAPGIDVYPRQKLFARTKPQLGRVSPFIRVDALGSYSGVADRDLGEKTIAGVRARGFSLDPRKIEPDMQPDSAMEVWADVATHRPVLVKLTIRDASGPMVKELDDFRWDVPIDPKLFETTPPQGYTDATPPEKSPEEIAGIIAASLRTFAEFSGGHYPRVDMLYGDVTDDELARLAGLEPKPQRPPGPDAAETYRKFWDARSGFGWINSLLVDNADASYHGKTVGPKDADKVLMRWRRDDGRDQVIYGDLRTAVEAPDRP
ncbi:hypothetical protein [Paludisphaera soli]|uniref:hypothetical protein n=1 Tax=Paludisphaera soli TaxID=2712865 RepID=UPI0013EC0BA9|nr:hypothetical protein [Paludisphaera soli]